jgi:hypothetical protein
LHLLAIAGDRNRDFQDWAIDYKAFNYRIGTLTESIQDTSPRIHPWRNKKPVSDKQAPEFIRGVNASILKSKI